MTEQDWLQHERINLGEMLDECNARDDRGEPCPNLAKELLLRTIDWHARAIAFDSGVAFPNIMPRTD